jgi:hypothetical protein
MFLERRRWRICHWNGMSKNRIKDPKGGLTAYGREYFKRKEGANLKPGVKENGEPTRLALAARAWGEPAPTNAAAAARLAAKGRALLKRYEARKKNG